MEDKLFVSMVIIGFFFLIFGLMVIDANLPKQTNVEKNEVISNCFESGGVVYRSTLSDNHGCMAVS